MNRRPAVGMVVLLAMVLGPSAFSRQHSVLAAPAGHATAAQKVLYKADWRRGTLGWTTRGDPGAQVVNRTLAFDGHGRSTLLAPFKTRRLVKFAIEMTARALADDSGARWGAVGIMVKGDTSGEGMVAGLFYGTQTGLWNSQSGEDHWIQSAFDPGIGWHTYRVEVRGSKYRLLVDGNLVGQATTTRYLSTKQYPRIGVFDFEEQAEIQSFRVLSLGKQATAAAATFASVRSANRSARVAERALQVGLRPLLMPSRLEDPMQKVRWVDEHWAHIDGNRASVEAVDGKIYLAMSVRNAGNGIAVLEAWHVDTDSRAKQPPRREEFRPHTRDLYIRSGDIGFWQAAVRDPNDPLYPVLRDAIQGRQSFTVDVLYGDHEGGQHTISRFVVTPGRDAQWLSQVARHWRVDAPIPDSPTLQGGRGTAIWHLIKFADRRLAKLALSA